MTSEMKVYPSPDTMMGPISLKQPLPTQALRHVDPFLLLHHFGPKKQKKNTDDIMDVGAHPHRGFEPVTFIFEGEIHHKDSIGNDSIIKAGGVQWMTAGSGIVHSENASAALIGAGGDLEIIQLWINLPTALKMSKPQYQGFQPSDIPKITFDNAVVNLMAGEMAGQKGPVESLTGIQAATLNLETGGKLTFEKKAGQQGILYQLKGATQINGADVEGQKMLILSETDVEIHVQAKDEATLLYVSGATIAEPISQYGPFVMNTQEEIMKAMHDYQNGMMGTLT